MDVEVIYNIRRIRKIRGMTIEELAKRAEVSSGQISDIENGKHHATVPFICRLAIALRVPAEKLYIYRRKK